MIGWCWGQIDWSQSFSRTEATSFLIRIVVVESGLVRHSYLLLDRWIVVLVLVGCPPRVEARSQLPFHCL